MFTDNNVYVTSLHVKNIRLFKELNIKFNKRFNFIVGPNGVGKTSILRCIALSISSSQIEDSRYGDGAEVWTDLNYYNKQYRIGEGSNSVNTWVKANSYMSAIHGMFTNPPVEGGGMSISNYQGDIESNIPLFCPLFIGAYRKINYVKINGMTREDNCVDNRSTYREKSAKSLNGSYLPNVKQWMINRYFLIDKDWAIKERRNWNWLISNFNLLFPGDNKFKFEEIRRDLEPTFSLNGQICYLEELSAGFQSVLSIILTIFEWIEATNEGDGMLVENASGTVIIDELDVHLHPEWQLNIRNTLDKMFPNLQFIVTTHSPHLIATAEQGELIILPEHVGFIDASPVIKSYSGWSTDQILEDIMGVKSLENKVYTMLVGKAIDCVEKKDTDSLKIAIKELERVIHPSDTIVTALKVKLASMELGGETF